MVGYNGIQEPKGMSSKETMFSAIFWLRTPSKFKMWFFSLKPIAILRSHHQKHAVLKFWRGISVTLNDVKRKVPMAQQYSTSTHCVAATHLNNTGNSRSSPKNNTGWSWFSPHETCNILGIPVGKSTYHFLGYKSYISDRIQRNGWFVWYRISSVAKIQGKNNDNYIYICMYTLVYVPTKLNLPCFHRYCPSYEL